jgi:hypothetical protein
MNDNDRLKRINEAAIEVSKCREAEIMAINNNLSESFMKNIVLARMIAERNLKLVIDENLFA